MLGPVLHVLLVLWLAGGWVGALGFFLASLALLRLRDAVRPARRGWAAAAGLVVLTLLLAVLRRELTLFGRPVDRLAVPGLTFVGVSYCYLRVAYALFDPRPWTLRSFLRYYFFAPTFISGPIVLPHHVLETGVDDRAREGAIRIVYGALKIGLGQLLRAVVPLGSVPALAATLEHPPAPPLLWAGLFLSGLWLFLDFSGFSDLFIGLARWAGVRAPENFARPYAARDLTAFWQRWHVSLAEWLRSLIYTPFSRAALRVTGGATLLAGVVSAIVTMAVCGMWHGLSATFLVWGAWHGVGLGGHLVWREQLRPRLPEGLTASSGYGLAAWVLTHAWVTAGWAFFLPTAGVPFRARLDLLLRLAGAA